MANVENSVNFIFAIFGRHASTIDFIIMLRERGFPVPTVIISEDEEYLRDQELLSPYGLYGDVESLAKKGWAKLYKRPNVNSDEVLHILKKNQCNTAISISCRNIIKRHVIDFFPDRIFNLHDSYLPDERGGALTTWRILHGVDSMGSTIHRLEEGIDTGPIILQKKVKLCSTRPCPIDYLKAEVKTGSELLGNFLTLLIKKRTLPAKPQDNDRSLYFPRLFTEINGIINWDWEPVLIERFVRAFSVPYPGAYSFYRGRKIHILDVDLDPSMESSFHPYANGKIVTLMDSGSVRVIAGARAMRIKNITVDGCNVVPAEVLQVKYNLVSPHEEIAKARNSIPTTKLMNRGELTN